MRQIFSDKLLGPGMVGAAFKVAGVGLSFLFMKAVTHISGAEGWGLYTICATVALLGVSAARLGVDTVLVKQIGQARALGQFHRLGRALRQSTWAVLGVSLGLALALWLAAPPLSQLFGKPQLRYYLPIVALWIPPWALLFLFTEGLRGFGKAAAFQFLQTGMPFLLGMVLLAPVLMGYLPAFTADVPLITYGLGLYGTCGVALLVLRRAFHQVYALPERYRHSFRAMRRTALPILSTYLLAVALGQADVLLLGYLRPSAEAGLYATALRLSYLTLLPVQALGGMAAAGLAGLHATGRGRELAYTLRRTGRLVRLGTLPLWAGLCLASPWAMGFFGPSFVQAWPVLVWLATNQFFNALCGPIDVLLQMTGQERYYRNIIGLALGVNLVANAVFIPWLGLYGAALAQTLGMVFWNVAGLVRIYRQHGVWLLRVW